MATCCFQDSSWSYFKTFHSHTRKSRKRLVKGNLPVRHVFHIAWYLKVMKIFVWHHFESIKCKHVIKVLICSFFVGKHEYLYPYEPKSSCAIFAGTNVVCLMAEFTTAHVPVRVHAARPMWTSDLWSVFNQVVENVIRRSPCAPSACKWFGPCCSLG